LVEIACFNNKGILVPAGIVTTLGSEAAAGAGLEAAAGAEPAAASGFCVSAACPNAIPESTRTVKSPRIATSSNALISREYHAISS
jgi:hypothetical protein